MTRTVFFLLLSIAAQLALASPLISQLMTPITELLMGAALKQRKAERDAVCIESTTQVQCTSAVAPFYCNWIGNQCQSDEKFFRDKCAPVKDEASCLAASGFCDWKDDGRCELSNIVLNMRFTKRCKALAIDPSLMKECKLSLEFDCRFVDGKRKCFDEAQ